MSGRRASRPAVASPGRALAPLDEALVVLLERTRPAVTRTSRRWYRMGSNVMHSRERRAREIQSQIAAILLHDWDPIGIADDPGARDEYDSYVGGVYRVLATGGSLAEIEAHLRDIEIHMMGYDETTREADVARATAARRLAALDVRLERPED